MKKYIISAVSLIMCAVFLVPCISTAAIAAFTDEPYLTRYETTVGDKTEQASESYIHDSRFDENYEIREVIDVSVHQGNIDWQSVYSSGVRYAIIRIGYRGSTEGGLFTDSNYVQNLSGAIAAGLKVGVYFYTQSITTAEAVADADYVLNLIRGYTITMPVVFDFEFANSASGGYTGRLYSANLSASQASSICSAFCERVSLAGYTPAVYANAYTLTNILDAQALESRWQIWLAAYRTSANYSGKYEMWQYTSTGRVSGISTNVDKSFWYYDKRNDAPVWLTAPSQEMSAGSTMNLTATMNSAALNAMFASYSYSEISFSSDNEEVLTVDQNGVVTAVNSGNANVMASITVTVNDGFTYTDYTYSASVNITVNSTWFQIFKTLLNLFTVLFEFIIGVINKLA